MTSPQRKIQPQSSKTQIRHIMRTLKRHARLEGADADDYINDLFEAMRKEKKKGDKKCQRLKK
jgi:hypothetical protein